MSLVVYLYHHVVDVQPVGVVVGSGVIFNGSEPGNAVYGIVAVHCRQIESAAVCVRQIGP